MQNCANIVKSNKKTKLVVVDASAGGDEFISSILAHTAMTLEQVWQK